MEVIQYEVMEASNRGFFIAVFDETVKEFARASEEVFPSLQAACEALFSGSWTPA